MPHTVGKEAVTVVLCEVAVLFVHKCYSLFCVVGFSQLENRQSQKLFQLELLAVVVLLSPHNKGQSIFHCEVGEEQFYFIVTAYKTVVVLVENIFKAEQIPVDLMVVNGNSCKICCVVLNIHCIQIPDYTLQFNCGKVKTSL